MPPPSAAPLGSICGDVNRLSSPIEDRSGPRPRDPPKSAAAQPLNCPHPSFVNFALALAPALALALALAPSRHAELVSASLPHIAQMLNQVQHDEYEGEPSTAVYFPHYSRAPSRITPASPPSSFPHPFPRHSRAGGNPDRTDQRGCAPVITIMLLDTRLRGHDALGAAAMPAKHKKGPATPSRNGRTLVAPQIDRISRRARACPRQRQTWPPSDAAVPSSPSPRPHRTGPASRVRGQG